MAVLTQRCAKALERLKDHDPVHACAHMRVTSISPRTVSPHPLRLSERSCLHVRARTARPCAKRSVGVGGARRGRSSGRGRAP
jgi:hypothetical protein